MEVHTAEKGKEKHLPEIEVIREGNLYRITVVIGSKIPHPNTPEHHIKWIDIYYLPEDAEPVHLARIELNAHGERGPFTEPQITVTVTGLGKGKIRAVGFCNLHGLWESEADIS